MTLIEQALKKREVLDLEKLTETKKADMLMASKVEIFAPIIEALTSLKDVACKSFWHDRRSENIILFSDHYSVDYRKTSCNFWDCMGSATLEFRVNDDLQIIHMGAEISTANAIEKITDHLAKYILPATQNSLTLSE